MPGYAKTPLNDDVLIYSSYAERSQFLPSPNMGILTYIIDEDRYQYWNGSEWINISSGATVSYQSTSPLDPDIGTLWVDSDGTSDALNSNDYKLKADAILDSDWALLQSTMGVM